jgi:hypothetical protein
VGVHGVGLASVGGMQRYNSFDAEESGTATRVFHAAFRPRDRILPVMSMVITPIPCRKKTAG